MKTNHSPRLNKIYLFMALTIFVFSLFCGMGLVNSKEEENKDTLETIVEPASIMVGDTIIVKIAKDPAINEIPKLYFDKTKIPTFTLNNLWYRSLIPISASIKPGTYALEIYYKEKSKKLNININETKYPLESLTLSKEVSALKVSMIEKAEVSKALFVESPKKLWSSKFAFPSSGLRSTVYGVKRKINGVLDPDYFHKGLDFAARTGSNVIAPENGKAILIGEQSKGFVVNGNCIFLDHGHGVVTAYLHLSKITTKEGEFVKKGQIIGQVGSTGIASGPHLHWGLYVHGMTVDPLVWTSKIIE